MSELATSSLAAREASRDELWQEQGRNRRPPSPCRPTRHALCAPHSLPTHTFTLYVLPFLACRSDAGAAYAQVTDLLQRLLQVYIFHLVDSGAHRLVPLYACHLRAGLRHTSYQIYFEQLLPQVGRVWGGGRGGGELPLLSCMCCWCGCFRC